MFEGSKVPGEGDPIVRLGIAKERGEKLVHFCYELQEEIGEHKKFKDECSIMQYLVEQALKQEFTTAELVLITFKMGTLTEIMYPNPMSQIYRLMKRLGQDKE